MHEINISHSFSFYKNISVWVLDSLLLHGLFSIYCVVLRARVSSATVLTCGVMYILLLNWY